MEKIRAMESDKSKLEQEIHDLNDVIAVKKQEGEREQRRKERLENDVKVCCYPFYIFRIFLFLRLACVF